MNDASKFDAAYHREWYQKNKDRIKERKQRDAAKKREKIRAIIEQAKDKPCADCGKKFPAFAMDFDHLGDKEFTIGRDKYSRSEEKLLAEIAKCDVVCALCHRFRTHLRSIRDLR